MQKAPLCLLQHAHSITQIQAHKNPREMQLPAIAVRTKLRTRCREALCKCIGVGCGATKPRRSELPHLITTSPKSYLSYMQAETNAVDLTSCRRPFILSPLLEWESCTIPGVIAARGADSPRALPAAALRFWALRSERRSEGWRRGVSAPSGDGGNFSMERWREGPRERERENVCVEWRLSYLPTELKGIRGDILFRTSSSIF